MKTSKIMAVASIGTAFLLSGCTSHSQQAKKEKQPNILFICIDDFRAELGAYGSMVKSPNIDRLASEGSLFYRHYAQVPTSGASRACLLTGKLPVTEGDVSNGATVAKCSGKPETAVPESFLHQLRRNGYYTVGIGKISHHVDGFVYGYAEQPSKIRELPYSWDEMLFDSGKWGTGWNAFFGYAGGKTREDVPSKTSTLPYGAFMVKPYECADVPDEGYPDGLTANLAVKKLRELAKQDKPFCLAVGFFKPHLPFNAPKKYWDLYNEDELPVSPVPFVPENVNRASLHNSVEFNEYMSGEEEASIDKPVSDEYARKLRHANYACISYVDAQAGKVLDELKKLGLDKNTVVVVWGDHGWHLGDFNVWGKHTIFETALNSTLVMKVPGKKAGVKNSRIVSTIDIYPTLMELCHIDVDYPLDGKSFVRLLDNPDDPSWEDMAFGYYRNGISLRTTDYRYTKYFRNAQPDEELYQYGSDKFERKNIASEKPEVIEQLKPLWERGNTGIFQH